MRYICLFILVTSLVTCSSETSAPVITDLGESVFYVSRINSVDDEYNDVQLHLTQPANGGNRNVYLWLYVKKSRGLQVGDIITIGNSPRVLSTVNVSTETKK